MSRTIFFAIVSWLSALSLPAMAAGAKVNGTLPFSGAFSISYITTDLQYIDGRPLSSQPVFLMCLDVHTDQPDDGDPAEFLTNAGGAAIVGGSGDLGVAAVHWMFEQYYSTYHKNGTTKQVWAFQYAVWEIGNDFDGTAASIDPDNGHSHPFDDNYFAGDPEFVSAYEDMYNGFIAALPTLTTSYRSTSYTLDLFQNTDPTVQNMVALIENAPSAAADLAIVKSGPADAAAGSNVVYSVVVTNNGPEPAWNVVVTDPTPAGLTFVSNSGACDAAYPCSIGTLASGDSATITTTYSIPAGYAGPNPIVNTASVTSDTPDPSPANNSSTATTPLVGAPSADLAVTNTGPASVAAGNNVVYTVVVTNNGPDPAVSTVLTDPTPAGLTFVSNSGGCTTAYPCALGTMASGSSTTITSTFLVPAGYSGPNPITSTASVSSQTADPVPSNNSSTATTLLAGTPEADLAVTNAGPASVAAGNNVVYTVVVTNNGPDPAVSTVLTDPTPAGLTFVSNSGGCTTAYPCALGTMASGSSTTITSTFLVPAGYSGPNPITSTASVSSQTADPVPSNNSSTATTTLLGGTPSADLVVTKTGPASAREQETISYTIVVSNQGPDSVPDAVLADPTPSGLTYVSSTAPCASGFPCSLPPLAMGSSTSVTVTYTVQAGFSGSISNIATATSPTIPDPVPTTNVSVVTTVIGNPPVASAHPVPVDARWMLILIGLALAGAGVHRQRSQR